MLVIKEKSSQLTFDRVPCLFQGEGRYWASPVEVKSSWPARPIYFWTKSSHFSSVTCAAIYFTEESNPLRQFRTIGTWLTTTWGSFRSDTLIMLKIVWGRCLATHRDLKSLVIGLSTHLIIKAIRCLFWNKKARSFKKFVGCKRFPNRRS